MNLIMKTTLISAMMAGIISLIGFSINSDLVKKSNVIANDASLKAGKANTIAKSALAETKKMNKIYEDIYKLKDIPRLEVYPIGAEFYVPIKPEVPGQVKINIGVVIENHSEANAKSIAINFETRDWYNHPTSLFQIYGDAGQPIPHIASLAGGTKFLYPSYVPDAPASGEAGYISQDKPFLLKLTLRWKDNNNKKYSYVAFYKLEHSRLIDKVHLYFSQIEDYDSVNDGHKAFEYAEKSLKEYQYKEPGS